MIQRVCFAVAILALIDQMAAPGYLKSWTNTKGMKMLQAIHIKPVVVSVGKEVSRKHLYCRQPTTDYDRFLIQTGVKCLN